MAVVNGAGDHAGRMCAAVEELLPGSEPVRLRGLLTGGRRHAPWVLDTAVGPVVGKLIVEPAASVAARLGEHRRVWRAGAPVPRILACTTGTAALGPDMVVVTEFIAGVDAEVALPSLRPEVATQVMRDAGRAVAALQATGAPCFGEPGRPMMKPERRGWWWPEHLRRARARCRWVACSHPPSPR